MVQLVLPLVVVIAGAAVPKSERYPEATEVYRCVFGPEDDKNYDKKPDGWKRPPANTPGFPLYTPIEISEEASPVGDRCVRMDIDGGSAALFSPRIEINPLFGFVVETQLRMLDFEYAAAFISLRLLDERYQTIEVFESRRLRETDGWQKIRLGPITSSSTDAHYAVIGLHVAAGEQADLKGKAMFDDIWLGRLPRMSIHTNHPYNFFIKTQDVQVTCQASGFANPQQEVTFQLENALGDKLAEQRVKLDTRPSGTTADSSLEDVDAQIEALVGTARWDPPISGPGFYRLVAIMKGKHSLPQRRRTNVVVIHQRSKDVSREFGWTFPDGSHPLPLPFLSRLIGCSGIGWIKYPLWGTAEKNGETLKDLVEFSERLTEQGVEMIGLLKAPPESILEQYDKKEQHTAAEIFAPDPKVWYPSLEPVLTRLTTRVHRWQLGDDEDLSFAECAGLAPKIAQIRAELDRIGQGVDVGLAWQWINAFPQSDTNPPPWQFLALSENLPMTHQELATYLEASKGVEFKRWTSLRPLAKREYDTQTRSVDLVRRMIAAKLHGADAIFCPDPFDKDRGLLNPDGTPGELYMPWQTTATLLSGAKFLGSIRLPNNSPNLVFLRSEDAVMLVWNRIPTDEPLYLGEDVHQIDLWGRTVALKKQENRQTIRSKELPVFITGLHAPITQWRLDFDFAQDRLPSSLGRPHANSFEFRNHYNTGIAGKVALAMPETWTVSPPQRRFQLASKEKQKSVFDIRLPVNADSGPQEVRADFEVHADRVYRFSVFRRINVGMGEIDAEVSYRMNDRGELEVEQRFVNNSDTLVSLQCELSIPGRESLMKEVIRLGRVYDIQVYRIPNGKELVGKRLWLNAQEFYGHRKFNRRFIIKE